MNKSRIKEKAAELRQRQGGTIFSFPIHEEEPFSEYAVVVYAGGKYFVYPEAADISFAALGIKTILEQFKKHGQDDNYDRNVRLISYDAQINAPSVTMRRARNTPGMVSSRTPVFTEGIDVTPKEDSEELMISARGVLKLSCLEMLDKNPKGVQFMDKYYQLLAMRKYGKTAAAIKQEVRRMNKDQAIQWIERTYKHYILDDMEVMNIMQTVAGNKR